VDVGHPARLKLASPEPELRSLMLRKLHSRNWNEPVTAIYVLAQIGKSRLSITHFLAKTLLAASARAT
jgi:hypothetical protein